MPLTLDTLCTGCIISPAMAADETRTNLLTIPQVADELDCHPATVRRAIHAGRLAAAKVQGDHGLTWRVAPEALQDYLRSETGLNTMHKVMSLVPSSEVQDLAHLVHRLVEGMQGLHKVNERQGDELARLANSAPQVHKLILELAEARAQLRDRDRDLTAARALIRSLEANLAAERSRPWWRRRR